MRVREAIALIAAAVITIIAVPLGYYTTKGSGTWSTYLVVGQQPQPEHAFVAITILILATIIIVAYYRYVLKWFDNMLAAPPFVDFMYNFSALTILLRHPKVNLKMFLKRRRSHQNTAVLTPREVGRHRVSYDEFIKALSGSLPIRAPRFVNKWAPRMRGKCLYNLTHNIKPEVVVETGVAAGDSSMSILQALRENSKGLLVSIDLPDYLPTYFGEPVESSVGFLVPDDLKSRWKLELEDSFTSLPRIAEEFEIDIFIHDSLHTYEHMMFECNTVWPHLKSGGILLVHDVGQAFVDFARKVGHSYIVWERYGAIVK